MMQLLSRQGNTYLKPPVAILKATCIQNGQQPY